ncbi:MAG: succinoglycan biosynthesis protein ExoM [Alphaproteobacteria bacterium]|jgi:succinoglycan biosynthesis protein ExoM
MKIIVGICTYNRNEMLNKLLESLHSQINIPEEITLDIIVCDNSMKQSAKDVLTHKEIYLHENIEGIVHARNNILSYTMKNNYGALIFLDDDEIVQNDFIDNYVMAYHELNKPAFIAAPVKPLIDKEKCAVPWLENTSCYSTPTRASGPLTDKQIVGCGNVLINLEFIKKHKITFNKDFNVSGGEDALFFFEIQKNGGQGFWLTGAEVSEGLSDDRYTYSYFKKRCFTLSCSGVRAYMVAYGKMAAIIKWLPKSVLHIIFSIPLLCTGIISQKYKYKGVQHFYVGIGQVCGLVNIKLRPYKQNK